MAVPSPPLTSRMHDVSTMPRVIGPTRRPEEGCGSGAGREGERPEISEGSVFEKADSTVEWLWLQGNASEKLITATPISRRLLQMFWFCQESFNYLLSSFIHRYLLSNNSHLIHVLANIGPFPAAFSSSHLSLSFSAQEVQYSRGGHHGQRCALHHTKLLLQGPAERPDDGTPQDSGTGGISWWGIRQSFYEYVFRIWEYNEWFKRMDSFISFNSWFVFLILIKIITYYYYSIPT